MSYGAKLFIGCLAVGSLYGIGRYLGDQNLTAVAYVFGAGVMIAFFSWLKSDTTPDTTAEKPDATTEGR